MIKTFNIRYGRNYKVVLAIVLPCLLIAPFILLMQYFPNLAEWEIWVIIFTFLGSIISLSLWLVFQVYPKVELNIRKDEISLSFNHSSIFSPSDFSFKVSDISSFVRGEIGEAEYYIFETVNPSRKFQVSAYTDSFEDILSFDEAMGEIGEMVNAVRK